jgi:hypothetical protein
MRLFDFKFLILLALALVVYFMYKELENQRDRILYCEEKIKQILDKNEEKPLELPNKVNTVINPPQIVHQQQSLNLQLPPKTFIKQTIDNEDSIEEQSSSNTSNTQNYIVNKNTFDQVKNAQNKIVEIYSNDNENNLETSISDTLVQKKIHSLNSDLTSSEKEYTVEKQINQYTKHLGRSESSNSDKSDSNQINKNNKTEDKENNETEDKENDETEDKETNETEDEENDKTEDKENNETEDKENDETEETENNMKEEMENNQTEDENTSENNSIDLESIKQKMKESDTFLDDSSEDSDKNKSESTLELEKVLEDLKDEMSENKKKYEYKLLNGMKLKDLQNLIKNENLTLDKKINGVSKKKTKQELIDELSKI